MLFADVWLVASTLALMVSAIGLAAGCDFVSAGLIGTLLSVFRSGLEGGWGCGGGGWDVVSTLTTAGLVFAAIFWFGA